MVIVYNIMTIAKRKIHLLFYVYRMRAPENRALKSCLEEMTTTAPTKKKLGETHTYQSHIFADFDPDLIFTARHSYLNLTNWANENWNFRRLKTCNHGGIECLQKARKTPSKRRSDNTQCDKIGFKPISVFRRHKCTERRRQVVYCGIIVTKSKIELSSE